jgi:hypothetical protein
METRGFLAAAGERGILQLVGARSAQRAQRASCGAWAMRRARCCSCVRVTRTSVRLARLDEHKGEEIVSCEQAGIAVTVSKPLTSNAAAVGRFNRADFVYDMEKDAFGRTEKGTRKCAAVPSARPLRIAGPANRIAARRAPETDRPRQR